LTDLEKRLNDILASITLPGREEEARVIVLSLIAKQHAVLISPPGTGKSLLISRLVKSFNVPYFEYLLTKFTLPEELFGPPDVKLLREQGKYKIITTGRLPEARIAFLDEIFKGSSAILNSLLGIINERKFFDGERMVDVPLWSLFSASNEVPDEPELQAFYDRFLFRHFHSYLPPELWDQYLVAYWNVHRPGGMSPPSFDFKVIEDAHRELWNVDVFAVKDKLLKVLAKAQDVGVTVSDRRKGRALVAIAANAVLSGRTVASPEDLSVLVYVLPATEKEKELVQQVVADVAGRDLAARRELRDIIPQLRALIKEVENAPSYQEALRVAQKLAHINARVAELRGVVSDAPELEEIRKLVEEFNEKLVSKVSV